MSTSLPNTNVAQIRLGTSSWTADGWAGSFYPAGTRQADFLPLYARRFDTVEIDSTFYRIPTARTVEQWRERTPDGFTFAAKIPRTITHEKMLVDVEEDLAAFLQMMDLLGGKLGPLLLQFPYFDRRKFRGVGFFLERLEPFLRWLPKGYQWTVEIRNRNWLSGKLHSVLREHGVALAMADHAWMPRPHELFETGDPVTADFAYVRWIGDRKGIEERTRVWDRTIVDRTEELREWSEILRPLSRRVKVIYGYANNHYGGHVPDTVELFRRLWAQGQGGEPGSNKGAGAGAGQPVQQALRFPERGGIGNGSKQASMPPGGTAGRSRLGTSPCPAGQEHCPDRPADVVHRLAGASGPARSGGTITTRSIGCEIVSWRNFTRQREQDLLGSLSAPSLALPAGSVPPPRYRSQLRDGNQRSTGCRHRMETPTDRRCFRVANHTLGTTLRHIRG